MGREEFAHRQIGKKSRVLGDKGNWVGGGVFLVLGRGDAAVDKETAPGRRVVVGEKLYVVDQGRFA